MSTYVFIILSMICLVGLSFTVSMIIGKVFSQDKNLDELEKIIDEANSKLNSDLTAEEENYVLWEALIKIEKLEGKKETKVD